MNTALILLGGLGWVLAIGTATRAHRARYEADSLARQLTAERELTCSLSAQRDRDAGKLCWLKGELARLRADGAHVLHSPHRN